MLVARDELVVQHFKTVDANLESSGDAWRSRINVNSRLFGVLGVCDDLTDMTAIGWGTTAYSSLSYSDIDVNLIQRADLCVDTFLKKAFVRVANFGFCLVSWTCGLRLQLANDEASWYWICVS